MANSVTSYIEIIRTALHKYGMTSEDMELAGRVFTQFKKNGATRWLTYQTPALSYPTTHSALREISRNKSVATEYVAGLGFNTPKSLTVAGESDISGALAMLQYAPLVVKPEYGSLSRGVSRDVVSAEELESKLRGHLQEGDCSVIQEQVMGEEIRFVLIGKKLKAAILRKRPFVTGDGVLTIDQLIERENRNRLDIIDTMVPYPQLTSEMCDMRGLDRSYVPADGQEAVLGYGAMIMSGASMYDIVDSLDQGYRDMVESIAADMNADFIVIDIIVRNPSEFKDYWFIEFNTSPVLKLFYSCRDGKHFDAGRYLAEMIHEATDSKGN